MPPFDPNDPAPRTLTTDGGVQVIVKPAAPPARESESGVREPEAEDSRTIILPEGQTDEERRAFLDGLCHKHARLVDELLARRQDVLEESRKDLRQRVLVVLWEKVEKNRKVPGNLRAWLSDVVRKEVRNHKKLKRLPIQRGADAEEVPAPQDEPEGVADLAERRERLERCLSLLPADQAAVVRCLQIFDMTLEETAQAVGKAESTVYDLSAKAGKKLGRLMRALADGAGRAGENS